jgi:hypothetical protein
VEVVLTDGTLAARVEEIRGKDDGHS